MARPWVVVVTLSALLILVPAAPAQEPEYHLKASFLLNVARFTEWPARAFSAPDAPLVVCAFMEKPFGNALTQTLAKERAAGHPLLVRTISSPARVRDCHIVFVPRARTSRTRELAVARRDQGIVLVGEGDGVLQAGGDIAVTIEQRRVQFDINPKQATRQNVRFSSHLLRLARNAGQVVR